MAIPSDPRQAARLRMATSQRRLWQGAVASAALCLLLVLCLPETWAGSSTPPTAAELSAAKSAADRAFERYTQLATTPGAAGAERDAAVAEYRAALARYRALQAAQSERPAPVAIPAPATLLPAEQARTVDASARGRLELDGARIDLGGARLRPDQAGLRRLEASATDRASGLAGDLVQLQLAAAVTTPVRVELALPGSDGGSLMLGVGTEFRRDDGSRYTHFAYLPASATSVGGSASFVPAEFDRRQLRLAGGGSAQPVGGHRYTLGLFTRTVSQRGPNARFAVTHPRKFRQIGSEFLSESELDLLLSDLDSTFREFRDTHKYVYGQRKTYPINVHISDLESLDGAYDYNALTGIDGASISLHRSIFSKGYANGRIKARVIFAHEFFHFVQHNYTAGSHSSDWFDEATSTYFEWKQAQGKLAIDVLQTHWAETFRGMLPESDSAIAGYARMPLIHYLSKRTGELFIRKVYEAQAKDHAAWAQAIAAATGLRPEQYVSDYYLDVVRQNVASWYAASSVYGSLVFGETTVPQVREVGRMLSVSVPEPADIKDKVDAGERIQLAKTTLEIEPLGARLVALSVSMPADRSGLAEDASFELATDNGGELRILQLARMGDEQSIAGTRIDGIKRRYGHGYTHLVVVTSPHPKGRRSITLKVEFDGGKAKPQAGRITRLAVDYRPETEPGDNAMTYLHNAVANMGKLDLVYRSETEFEITITAFSGSLSNGYDTERYSFPGVRLSGTITPGKRDRHGNFGSVQGRFKASSTTTDQRGNRYTLEHDVTVTGTIYHVNTGILTLRLDGDMTRSGGNDRDRPSDKVRRSTTLRFTYP